MTPHCLFCGLFVAAMGRERDSAPPSVDLEPEVTCPVCRRPADRMEFGGISSVLVDVCSLHGLWLDGGEQERLEKLVELEHPKQPSLAGLVLRDVVRRLRRR